VTGTNDQAGLATVIRENVPALSPVLGPPPDTAPVIDEGVFRLDA
jgi:hypothetical protein